MSKQDEATKIFIRVKESLSLCVRQNRLYIWNENGWKALFDSEAAIAIRKLYPETARAAISSSNIKEVLERLLQDPELQRSFTEETEEKYINLQNGVFDTETGKFETDRNEFDFGYYLKFSYLDKSERKMPNFDAYIHSTFCEEADPKRKLMLQMLGYIVSDYTKAKTGFFLIGASNSGKSTLLDLIKRILPEQSITTIPLYRLDNRFNLAKLADARLNICTELSEKSFKAMDIYKMLTSNETVTAEHKGKKPFEFRIRCKSINAGNVLPNIDNLEGMDAILNRMTILLFPNGIPDNKKDLHLCEKLWEERNSIFSEAMDELVELCKNNFIFAEPQDTKKLKAQMAVRGLAFEDFISECCKKERGVREHFVTLYEAFCEYCEENLLEVKFSKTQFSQKLVQMSGVSKGKFRLNGGKPLYGVEGICLKETREYIGQDSEMSDTENGGFANTLSQNKDGWNNGTLEQKEEQYE